MPLEELEREIRAERPEPDSEFARRLDDWAAAGFPRGGELDPRAGRRREAGASRWLAVLRERLTALPPRRLLAPVGAAATLIVVGAVAISQSGGLDGGERSRPIPQAEPAPEAAVPDEPFSANDRRAEPQASLPPEPVAGAPAGGIARGTDERLIDASARLTLGAEADQVQEVANRVVEVTDSYEGAVLDSRVTSDQAGARASFTLELPYRDLDAALADLSELADVISLSEQGEDITAPAVRARKQLAAVHEEIRQARIELIRADTREERLILESRIASLEASADALEQQLGGVKRLARFATVAVEITSNGPDADDEGGWSLGDALEDAGRVLELIGGIALVSLAVLAPLALLGLAAWFLAARLRARGRERALDGR